MTDAVEAAANAVAHDAMVSGLDAVAARDVRRARPGVTTSDGTSSPSRTRWAADSVRTPMTTSTRRPPRPSPPDGRHRDEGAGAQHPSAP